MTLFSHSVAYDSPIGRLLLHSHGGHLVGVDIIPEAKRPLTSHVPTASTNGVLTLAVQQLHEYFAGTRTSFDIPTATSGTDFQQKIWTTLSTIPFGSTLSYRELGERAGVGLAPRAVGGAVGKNPLAIVIPCHRVLGATGTITGYSGGDGIITKEHLLKLESIPYRRTNHSSSGVSVTGSKR